MTTRMHAIVGTVGAVAVFAGVPILRGAPSDLERARDRVRSVSSTPCQFEDSADCRWDARSRGNGSGASFVTVRVGARDFVFYDDGRTVVYPRGS